MIRTGVFLFVVGICSINLVALDDTANAEGKLFADLDLAGEYASGSQMKVWGISTPN
jgi:hypothetical protein